MNDQNNIQTYRGVHTKQFQPYWRSISLIVLVIGIPFALFTPVPYVVILIVLVLNLIIILVFYFLVLPTYGQQYNKDLIINYDSREVSAGNKTNKLDYLKSFYVKKLKHTSIDNDVDLSFDKGDDIVVFTLDGQKLEKDLTEYLEQNGIPYEKSWGYFTGIGNTYKIIR